MNFEGEVAISTGAASGMGFLFARVRKISFENQEIVKGGYIHASRYQMVG